VGAAAYAAILLPVDAARRRDVRALSERLAGRLRPSRRGELGDATDS
jgi:hypothetical protein